MRTTKPAPAAPVCPARTYGRVGECRFCIYRPGGAPSDLCLKMRQAWEKERAELAAKKEN